MQLFRSYNLILLSAIVTMISVAVLLVLNFKEQRKNFETEETYSSNNLRDTKLPVLDNHSSLLNLDFKYLNKFEMIEGDTFVKILQNASIPNNEINKIIEKLNKYIDLGKLKVGTQIDIVDEFKNEKRIWNEISIYKDKNTKITVTNNEGVLSLEKQESRLFSKLRYIEVNVKNSIYQSLLNKNVADNVIMDFVQLFSFDVDFQRDIRNGNTLRLFYEEFVDDEQSTKKFGPIYFAEIGLESDKVSLFRFKDKNSNLVEYFDENGKSATKALMKTPINGARISSGYGMRKHPILGYNKKHQGVDFAAPTGTPIMAAGNGHIEFVGTNGGAGKYIRIKHLNGYKTSYSHLSKYASGMKKNLKVKQGQVIGFVGNTGLSTGPHLHYEVSFNNEKINPMKMKLPSGRVLEGNLLDDFLTEKKNIEQILTQYIKS